MKRVLTAFLLVLIAGNAAATSIASENVTVDLSNSSVQVDMFVEDLTSSRFNYISSYEIERAEVKINGEPVSCTTNPLQIGTEISCETDERLNFTAQINMDASNLVREEQNFNTFRFTHSILRPTEKFNLKVILPEGTGLVDDSNVSTPVILPTDGEVSSNGRRIFVEWQREPSLSETMNFQVIYEEFSTSTVDYLKIFSLVVIGVLLISGVYLYLSRSSSESIEKVFEELEPDEEEVLQMIIENDGEMLQKDVVSDSNYSKAKISGIVKELVEKEIVVKEKEGRSNKLRISDEYSF